MIPTPNQTAFWNDRGEVREVKRKDGFCTFSNSADRVPAIYSPSVDINTYCEPSVNDLYSTEREAINGALEYADQLILTLCRRRDQLS